MRGEWLRKSARSTAVIFVHGVLSSAEGCWLSRSGTYWPALLQAESALESCGIYAFSYQTNVFSGTYRLGDVVDALKEHLRLDDVLAPNANVVFVCHSMGGIIVRKFLVERASELIDQDKNIGLFFLASPSLGSSYANWLKPLARFFGHAQADALRFAQSNAWLNDLDKEFQNLKESGQMRIRGKELIEDKFIVLPSFWRKQVVEPFAGARYFGEPFKVPLSDHFSIAKPESANDIQHRLLCKFISEMMTSNNGSSERSATSREPSPDDRIILDSPLGEISSPRGHTPERLEIAIGSDFAPIGGQAALRTLIDEVRDSISRASAFEVVVELAELTSLRRQLAAFDKVKLSLSEREERSQLRAAVRRFDIFENVPADRFFAEVITTLATHAWRAFGILSIDDLAECVSETIQLYGSGAWPQGTKFEVFPADADWYASFRISAEAAANLSERLDLPLQFMTADYGLRIDDFSFEIVRTRVIPALAFEYFRLKYAVPKEAPPVEDFFKLLSFKVGLG